MPTLPWLARADARIEPLKVGRRTVRGALIERERGRDRKAVVLVVQDQREHVGRRVREVQSGHVPGVRVEQRLQAAGCSTD